MESDFLPTAGGITELNLDNYFPNYRSYNSVVYYHKKFLNNTKDKKVTKKTGLIEKLRKSKFKETKNIDVNLDKAHHQTEAGYLNPVLENTLKFTNIPLVIPLAKDTSSPLIYTITTSKKHKHCDKKSKPNTKEKFTSNKEEVHKFESDKKRKNMHGDCESYSGKESIEPCSQNTLDDLNGNQSPSFSELNEVKFNKGRKKGKHNSKKYFVSSSFDALATESLNCENNTVKIHLMNESDKALFSESIKNPIINAIKDCLSQLTSNEYLSSINAELKTVQNAINCNTKKLDDVLKKITILENKIDSNSSLITKVEQTPKVRHACKASSTLEKLNEDLIVVRDQISDEDSSKEEEYKIPKRSLRCSGKSVVVAINENYRMGEKKDTLGRGEEMTGLEASSSISQQVIKPDRPNKLPRFCWTDSDRLK